MRPYLDLNLLIAGALLFAAVQYAWIWRQGWRSPIPILFACLCLLSGLNALAVVGIFSSTTPGLCELFIRCRSTLASLNMLGILYFSCAVTGIWPRWLLWSATLILGFFTLLTIATPTQDHITALSTLTLPWGETITWYEHGASPWWAVFGYATVIAILGFGVWAGFRTRQRDAIAGWMVALVSILMFATTILHVVINIAGWRLPYPGGFATVPWIAMAFLLVSREYRVRGERLAVSEWQARQAEAHLRATIDAMPLMFWAQGPDGTYVIQNRMSRDLYGDCVGRHPRQFAPDQATLDRWTGYFTEAMQGRPIDLAIAATVHGEARNFRVIVAPITEAGTPAGCIGMVIDQTAEHLALEQARESELRFSSIFNHAPEAILISRVADGRIVDANTGFERLSGWTVEEAKGQTTLELGLFPDPQERERLRADVLVQQGFLDGGTSTIRRKDGRLIDVLLSVRQIELRGEPHFVALARDISDRLAMERELIDQRVRIVQAELLAKAGSILITSDGHTWWSEGLRSLHGLPTDGPVPASVADYLKQVHPDDLDRVQAARQRLLRGEPAEGLRYRIIRGNQIRWLEARDGHLICDPSGNEAWTFQATVVDVTEREASMRQIVSQEREAVVGRMAGRVAHEVNNPLEAIKALIEPLKRRSEGTPKVVEGLVVIDRQVDRIAKLVRGLLGLVRQRAQIRTQVQPAEILHTVGELFQPRFAKSGKQLVIDIPTDLPHAVVDADQVQQVAINLIENALAAIPAGGTVRLGARVEDKVLEVVVEDDGPGLGDDPERLFQAFYTTKSTGTGLGLSVARTICENHQGSLVGENRQPHGACFRMRLRTDLPSDRTPNSGTTIQGGVVQV